MLKSAELQEALAEATAAIQQYRVIAFRVIEEFESGLKDHGISCQLLPPHCPLQGPPEDVRESYHASEAVCFHYQSLSFHLRLGDARRGTPARVHDLPFRIRTTPSGWIMESDAASVSHELGCPTSTSRLDYSPVYGKIGDLLFSGRS